MAVEIPKNIREVIKWFYIGSARSEALSLTQAFCIAEYYSFPILGIPVIIQ